MGADFFDLKSDERREWGAFEMRAGDGRQGFNSTRMTQIWRMGADLLDLKSGEKRNWVASEMRADDKLAGAGGHYAGAGGRMGLKPMLIAQRR